MGAVRDFFKGIGIISSAGSTVSSAGIRLLNLRNQLGTLEKVETPKMPSLAESVSGYSRAPTRKAAKRGKRKTASAGFGSALERKRKYNRERMRRLRAKRRQQEMKKEKIIRNKK